MEQLPLGIGLVLGGGAALYLSPTLPPPTKGYAIAGGVAGLAIGGYMVWRALAEGGGTLGFAARAVFGDFGDDVAPTQSSRVPTPTLLDVPTSSSAAREGRAPELGLVVTPLAPTGGSVVDRGLIDGRYSLVFDVTNQGPTSWHGTLVIDFVEEYAIDIEQAQRLEPLSIAPFETIRKTMQVGVVSPLAFNSPTVTVTVKAGGLVLARWTYEVDR